MKRRLISSAPLFMGLALGACSADQSLAQDPIKDENNPHVEVRTPTRGKTLTDGSQTVTVTGLASDDVEVAQVSVNGQNAVLAADGTFSVQVTLKPGVTLLHTVATDTSGNTDTDTRAVLSGSLVAMSTPVSSAFTAQITGQAIGVLGQITGGEVGKIDFNGLAQAASPVVDVGGSCFGAKVNVTSLTHGAVNIGLTPVEGGLAIDADIANLNVALDVPFDLFCAGDSTSISMSADHFHLTGTVAVGLDGGGKIQVSIVNDTPSFDNYMLHSSALPDQITGLIEGPVGDWLSGYIGGQIHDKVPPLVAKFLGGFSTSTTIAVLGKNLLLSFNPTQITFDASGGKISLDAMTYIPDAAMAGLMYLQNQTPRPTFDDVSSSSVRIAVADDTLNQLLSSFWGAGVMDQSVDVKNGNYAGLGTLFDRIDVNFLLPPVVTALGNGKGLQVDIGDVELSFVKVNSGQDSVITRLAVSAETTLNMAITPQNTFKLDAAQPQVWIDTLTDGVTGSNPLNSAVFEALGSFAASQMVTFASGLLEKIQVPQFDGATISSGEITTGMTEGGYVLVTGNLVKSP